MTKIEGHITLALNDLDNKEKGSYILIIELLDERTITVGSLKAIRFLGGYYAYVGSALAGFKSRLNHHLKGSKRPHWHIDYLLPMASISTIILFETRNKIECTIAHALSQQFNSIPGFGSSDCQCRSHLLFATEERQLESAVISNIGQLDIRPRLTRPARLFQEGMVRS